MADDAACFPIISGSAPVVFGRPQAMRRGATATWISVSPEMILFVWSYGDFLGTRHVLDDAKLSSASRSCAGAPCEAVPGLHVQEGPR